jgi:hypothetical protein
MSVPVIKGWNINKDGKGIVIFPQLFHTRRNVKCSRKVQNDQKVFSGIRTVPDGTRTAQISGPRIVLFEAWIVLDTTRICR